MKIADVEKRLARIQARFDGQWWGDDEACHAEDDDLRDAVLRSIAAGKAEDPRKMARLVLTTNKMDFARWYA